MDVVRSTGGEIPYAMYVISEHGVVEYLGGQIQEKLDGIAATAQFAHDHPLQAGGMAVVAIAANGKVFRAKASKRRSHRRGKSDTPKSHRVENIEAQKNSGQAQPGNSSNDLNQPQDSSSHSQTTKQDRPDSKSDKNLPTGDGVNKALQAIKEDYWGYSSGIQVSEAKALSQKEGFNFDIGRKSYFNNDRNAVIIGKDKLKDGQVNKIELAEEIQHGLDKATNEATRFFRKNRDKGLSMERINSLFHVEHFKRVIKNWESGKLQFLTIGDIEDIKKIIEELMK